MTTAPQWLTKRLDEVVSLRRGHDLTWRERRPGGVPVIGSAGANGTHDQAIARGPGVVLGRSGASYGQAHYVEVDYWPHNTALYATDFHRNDPRFVYYLLDLIDFRHYNSGGAQQSLNRNFIAGVVVGIPGIEEQQRVAAAIDDAERLIATLERLIAKKQAIKQGVMQQLLTGRTRLPGFDKPWGERHIGDFAAIRAGGTPATGVSGYWGGDIPWMSSGEIHQKQVHHVEGRITQLGLQRSSAKVMPPGTVLMALAGQGKTRGTVAVSRIELTTNQSIAGIYPSEHHDSNYLYYNLDARYAELRGESAGDGGRGGLNLTIIKRLAVPLPSREEQSAIARVILDADAEIAVLRVRLAKAHAVRTGMMQQLLTGRTRLPVEAAS